MFTYHCGHVLSTGGSGCVAFARDANIRVGPPSGGDAGKGGSIYLEADPQMRSLQGVLRQLRAGDGGKVSEILKTNSMLFVCIDQFSKHRA
jgi:GTPase involved in cell partitioning and DNA repair